MWRKLMIHYKKKTHKIELIDKNLSQWSENIQQAKEKLF